MECKDLKTGIPDYLSNFVFLFQAAQTEAISAISLSTMLLNMDVSQETKEALYKEIFCCTFPILRDRTVLILTILLTIFDQVQDEKIEQLKDDFSKLLQRYLEEKEQSMETISTCINNLHRVCQIFKDLKICTTQHNF